LTALRLYILLQKKQVMQTKTLQSIGNIQEPYVKGPHIKYLFFAVLIALVITLLFIIGGALLIHWMSS